MSAADEILDIVDAHDHVIGQAPRGEVYARGLRHRCVFVLATDPDGHLFVHRRTPTKLAFPSCYDMFVGGVVGAGESYDDAALREAEEELGVQGLPRPVPLLKFLYEDDSGPRNGGDGEPFAWWSWVYQVRCDLPVQPQPEEIDWYGFLTEQEVDARLGTWEWTPDGLAAYALVKARRGEEGGTGVAR
ncbi:NUDIX domain-containing protein [Streptomyces sp. NA04227]|uniref:NUDIX hydrolase n=1 Tax=Streptomyces sp. NA04227 TaxID=2742136 RepID=UPI00159052FC|nr:NUDIX domain-containing protein [Streptomyces sp. NA04227]QKW05667.1 NUDIX domain-containing protein [Streptomyces sp. NA04227]